MNLTAYFSAHETDLPKGFVVYDQDDAGNPISEADVTLPRYTKTISDLPVLAREAIETQYGFRPIRIITVTIEFE